MTLPSFGDAERLLEECRPLSVLRLLQGDLSPELALLKSQALLYLDNMEEATSILTPLLVELKGDMLTRARKYQAQVLLNQGQVDESIFMAQSAIQSAQSDIARANGLVELASGYSRKTCFQLADSTLRDAKILLGPGNPLILLREAYLMLERDERLAARDIFQKLLAYDVPWAVVYGNWGLGMVALLLGDFAEARRKLNDILSITDEMINVYLMQSHLAIIDEDVALLEKSIDAVASRSPNASSLPAMREDLARLQKQVARSGQNHKRLKSFPTTIQKRNYCGPSTIDLVLRFWKSNEEFSDDQIAAYVKLPHSGTPIYRMREFFHLVGFDTIRCVAPPERLKQLIDAGFPVIVTEEFPDNAHVSVVIGYDNEERLIEFQDPSTHRLIPLPENVVNDLRRTYLDEAVVAFPHGKGYDEELARLGFFDEPALIWTDQAGLALEKGDFNGAASLAELAANRLPTYPFAWILGLSARLSAWQNLASRPSIPRSSILSRVETRDEKPDLAEKKFNDTLRRALELFPSARFSNTFAGMADLQRNNPGQALKAFKRASEIEPNASNNYIAMAECYYYLREDAKALQSAREGLKKNPTSPAVNVWMARCLAQNGDRTAYHYARCAMELAPTWSTTRLAMAEYYLFRTDYPKAQNELTQAIAINPQDDQALVRRAILNFIEGFHSQAVFEMEKILKKANHLPLYARYNALQMVCRYLFGRKKFKEAQRFVKELLKIGPDDPWAIQFLAAASSEILIKRKFLRQYAARQVCRLYERAVTAYHANPKVVSDYLQYLSRLDSSEHILAESERLYQKHSDTVGLLTLHARSLARFGKKEQAAALLIEGLNKPGEINSYDDNNFAAQVILSVYGEVETGKIFLESDSMPRERCRAFGLALAQEPEKYANRAREVLQEVLAANPDDAFATLRLGDVTENLEEKEALYRKSVRLMPTWPFGRNRLASFLMNNNHPAEALEYLSGHQNENADLMTSYGRALFMLGRFEEAMSVFQSATAASEELQTWKFNNLWLSQHRAGEHRAALNTARRGLKLFPSEKYWYQRVATSLLNLGNFGEADRVIQVGRSDGIGWKAYIESEYESAMARGRYNVALQWADKLVYEEKDRQENRLSAAEDKRLRALLKRGFIREARTLLNGKKFTAPEDWHTPIWICLECSAWDLACELAETVHQIDNHNFDAMFAKVEALAEKGKIEEAMPFYNELGSSHPHEHNAYEKIALHYAIAGQLEQALQLADRAVLLGPYCYLAWGVRGYIHFLSEHWAAAQVDLETSWKRAKIENKREDHIYWWMLASLQNKPLRALYYRELAQRECTTPWRRHQVNTVDKKLRNTIKARLSLVPFFAYAKKFFGKLAAKAHPAP